MQLHIADVDLVDPDHDIVQPLQKAGELALGQMLGFALAILFGRLPFYKTLCVEYVLSF